MKKHFHGFAMFVLPLAAALAASCAKTGPEVDLTPTARLKVDAHVGKGLSSDSTNVADITDDFAPNEVVFAVVDVPGRVDGTVKGRWVYGEETVQESSTPVQEGVNVYRFRLIPPEGGNKPGDYRFEVYVNDNRSDMETFKVRSP